MLTRRFHLPGLFAVLLALMAQLGAGAAMPQMDPVAGVSALCHSHDAPAQTPAHLKDCLVCPLCVVVHAQQPALVASGPALPVTTSLAVLRSELPPPATAPPALHRPPSQPRAPPAFS